jgi:hypothetical protein
VAWYTTVSSARFGGSSRVTTADDDVGEPFALDQQPQLFELSSGNANAVLLREPALG